MYALDVWGICLLCTMVNWCIGYCLLTSCGFEVHLVKKVKIRKSVKTSPYFLNFGKHRGLALEEVPLDYIKWLVKNNIHNKRHDLACALVHGGFIFSTKCEEHVGGT